MAAYYLSSRFVSRKKGSGVTRAAAYRAGERIRDKRTGETHDHSKRADVVYKEILLPANLAWRPDMAWARDRSTLWNAVEQTESRRDACLAREWHLWLPHELTAPQRQDLARRFGKELAEKYRCAVDLCIHLPRPTSDSRHHHAHLLMTKREVSPAGFERRSNLELSGIYRHQLGIPGTSREEYLWVRERWAELSNEALLYAGLAVRVDHRSYEKRGIDREPAPTLPDAVRYAEQKSQAPLAAGDAIRAGYNERVEARLKSSDERARVVQRQMEEGRELAIERARQQQAEPKQLRWGQLTKEERKEVRRERYVPTRELEKRDPEAAQRRREVQNAASRRYRAAHPERSLASVLRYRAAHPQVVQASSVRYWQVHGVEIGKKRREQYWANPEEARRKAREGALRSAQRKILEKYSPLHVHELTPAWPERREHGGGLTAEGLRNGCEQQQRSQQSRSVTQARGQELRKTANERDKEHSVRRRDLGYDLEM
jgi:hypothetical protein